MVVTFDTAFYQTLPERAYRYAIPYRLAEKHGIRRYGFHGLAHRYMTERYAAITSTLVERTKLITLQLGNVARRPPSTADDRWIRPWDSRRWRV